MKIKKVDDKPMIIHTKKKTKIHMHENQDAKIKGHNVYTVDHSPMSKGSTTKQTESVNQGKESYRKSTILQNRLRNLNPISQYRQKRKDSNRSVKIKNSTIMSAPPVKKLEFNFSLYVLEMFELLADNFDDVLESVLKSVEETICNDESAAKLNRIDKSLSALESKRKKLTDMLLDDKITKDAYDEKYDDITRKIKQEKEERSLYASNVNAQKDVGQRMRDIRILLNEAEGMKKFDRVVFESIVEKVIVGETKTDGSPDPYKLTFVLRGINDRAVPNAKNRYLNLRKKKK